MTASKYPFPTVCADKASTDWFGSISRTLRWNEREKQKSFVVVEEDSEPAAKTATRREGATGPNKVDKIKENDSSREDAKGADQIDGADKPEDAEEDDEEEDFDIDEYVVARISPQTWLILQQIRRRDDRFLSSTRSTRQRQSRESFLNSQNRSRFPRPLCIILRCTSATLTAPLGRSDESSRDQGEGA